MVVILDPADHIAWARKIALWIAAQYGLKRSDTEDIVSTAYLVMCRYVARFNSGEGFDFTRLGDDPTYSFRAWCFPNLRCECRREIERIRGGGTFRSVRPENLHTVPPLSDLPDFDAPTTQPDLVDCETETIHDDKPTPDHCATIAQAKRYFATHGKTRKTVRIRCPYCGDSGVTGYIDGVRVKCTRCNTKTI